MLLKQVQSTCIILGSETVIQTKNDNPLVLWIM